MTVVQAEKAMFILMILYSCAVIFGFLASVPMVLHVYPQSECLLFSSIVGGRLNYGHYASCNVVAYVFLFVIAGAIYLLYKCWSERRRRHGHAKAGKFEDQHVPKSILLFHLAVTCLALLLTLIVTSGYVSACNNLDEQVSKNVQEKLNANPFDTRGEEILTRYEDDYKFHRYTNRYGNAFGSEFYTIRITCRSILTDPEIHQKLHDSHYEKQSRYYGYWYGQDLFAYDSQYEASKTNALIEASMAGAWLCFVSWIAGLILMIIQRYVLKKEAQEAERVSVHTAMMGSMHKEGSMMGYPRNGSSMISGSLGRPGSGFQRGGSTRGSDRSIKSHRRDIDDIALSMHHLSGSQHLLGSTAGAMTSGYGRKDIDDMVRPRAPLPKSSSHQHFFKRENSLLLEAEQPHGIMILNGDGLLADERGGNFRSSCYHVPVPHQVLNQHIAQFSGGQAASGTIFNGQYPSHYSSHETGYISGNEGSNPRVPRASNFRYTDPESTKIVQREEVETEIF